MSGLRDIRTLSARRAYEFLPDDIRLTVLCTNPVVDFIRQTFDFQHASVGTPPELFGEVPEVIPPGLVFATGSMPDEAEGVIPVRFLHVEPRRIVIDVAAPSEAIAPVFERLVEAVSSIPVAGGTTTIGTVFKTVDYSMLTAKFPVPLSSFVNPKVAELLSESAARYGKTGETITTLYVQQNPADLPYPGPIGPETGAAQITLRAGTKPEDCIFVSSAFLDTDAHRGYLERLAKALSGRVKSSKQITAS